MSQTKPPIPREAKVTGLCCAVCFALAISGCLGLKTYQNTRERDEFLSVLSPELPDLTELYFGTKHQRREAPVLIEGINSRKETPKVAFPVQDRVLVLRASDEMRGGKGEVTLGDSLERVPVGNRPSPEDFSEKQPVTIFILGPAARTRRLLVVSWPEKTIVLNAAFDCPTTDFDDKIRQWIDNRIPTAASPPGLSPAAIWWISFAVPGLLFLVAQTSLSVRREYNNRRVRATNGRPSDCSCTWGRIYREVHGITHYTEGVLICGACKKELEKTRVGLVVNAVLLFVCGLLVFGGLWWHFVLGSLSLFAVILLATLVVLLSAAAAVGGLLLLTRIQG